MLWHSTVPPRFTPNCVPAVIVASLTVYESDAEPDNNHNDANYGEVVDLFAPGDNIVGAWSSSTPGVRNEWILFEVTWGGAAAAYVAGAAALVLEVRGLQAQMLLKQVADVPVVS